MTAEDFCSKEGAVDSVDEPPAVPGVREERDLRSGVFGEPGRPFSLVPSSNIAVTFHTVIP